MANTLKISSNINKHWNKYWSVLCACVCVCDAEAVMFFCLRQWWTFCGRTWIEWSKWSTRGQIVSGYERVCVYVGTIFNELHLGYVTRPAQQVPLGNPNAGHIFSHFGGQKCVMAFGCAMAECAQWPRLNELWWVPTAVSISDTNINQVTGFRQCSDAYGVRRFWTIEQKSCRSCELKKTTNTLYVPSVPELNCYSISKSRIYRHLDHHLYLHLNHESPMTNTNSNHVFRTLLIIV